MRKLRFSFATLYALLFIFGCSQDSLDELSLEEELTFEIEDRASCDDCSYSPGSMSKFKNALELSKYEYTGSSSKYADDYCSAGRFSTCGDMMVLQSGGLTSNRSELKLDGSLSFDKESIMRVEMIVENTPSLGDRGLTIAQIHNRYRSGIGQSGRPPLRIDIVDGRIRAVYAHSYIPDTGTSTYDLMGFNDGDRIYIKLEIEGNGKKINYYVKNKSTGVSKSKSISVHSPWTDSNAWSKYYFKSGAYQQTSSSGARPKVSYSRFTYDLE